MTVARPKIVDAEKTQAVLKPSCHKRSLRRLSKKQ
jgi:hypothetical protein